MAFFENFTSVIRQKWLDYVQANRPWLELQMRQTSVRTPDGGRRPSSFLVLGVVNAIEPKLSNLMVPFYQLNADEDALVEVLGLNFDPEMALDNGGTPQTIEAEDAGVTPMLPDAQDAFE
ncbi:MAG: DUF5331 domain-containing protein [Leptolyngbya sp. SIO4C5]|uniref:DUF5331 domain-containing protein n=1 Tax=Sphaerothrix gracilis TaxID=3151835 RepID=UPI0013C0DABF|nr:DUF5331 domain-containing protein [Leptolyngbya sp. SIO4C5]